jgi:hypothetical protein
MKSKQKLLALDAAIVAIEGDSVIPDDIQNLLFQVQDWLDNHFNEEYSDIPFDKHLEDQRDAVKALASSPEVFEGIPA